MAGRGLPPDRMEAVLGYLAAGVSKNSAYRLDLKLSGVSRLAAKRAAAAEWGMTCAM